MARVEMKTNQGTIVLELDGQRAPISTLNFLQYVDEGFYNGTIFHRVIPTFMIQGGGYLPDYTEKPTRDMIKNEWRNGLRNVRGSIAMARRDGNADSASSQFFINVVDNPSLDRPRPDGGAYAVFGRVLEGMYIVDKIKDVKTHEEPRVGNAPAPDQPVVIESVTILEDIDREAARQQIGKASQLAAEASKAQEQAALAKQTEQIQELKKSFMEVNGGKVNEMPSGLLMFPFVDGSGPSPTDEDTVMIHFDVKLPDGTTVATTRIREEGRTFPVKSIRFKGLAEGIRQMKAGGKAKLILPPSLGAGERGQGMIPPNSYLVLDVDLISINPQPDSRPQDLD